jgi:hypothetical protein
MNAYWAQFSKTEIDSMHGLEPEDPIEYEDEEIEQKRPYECDCMRCNECLCVGW